jgi:hypothetical protein
LEAQWDASSRMSAATTEKKVFEFPRKIGVTKEGSKLIV